MSAGRIKIHKFDKSKLKRYALIEEQNIVWLDMCEDHPSVQMAFEEWRREEPSKTSWTFTDDEVQYGIKGKAEITYTSPPWHSSESKTTIIVGEGDLYLIPKGTRWTRKVISNEPYLHLCVIIPKGEPTL